MNMIWEVSLPEFIFVTVILGGGAAWMSGRAVARSWEPYWIVALWMLLLGAAVRFIHFALFHGSLVSLHYYIVDTAILLLISALGHRFTRTSRTVRQYSWLYEKTSPFSWRRRTSERTYSA